MSMNIARRALQLAHVPEELHEAVLSCLQEARRRASGLFAHQLRARLAAGRIARQLPWEAETVEDALPQLASYGVAPNLGNGVNGDNQPWAEVYRMPDGSEREVHTFGKPRGGELPEPLRTEAERVLAQARRSLISAGGVYVRAQPTAQPQELDKDPASLSYRTACARNYWGHRFWGGAEGTHPRSVEARTAWLRSNGGEREAWNRGMPVAGDIQRWQGQQNRWCVQVWQQGDVWQINVQFRIFGRWQLGWRLGFEIDNSIHAHSRQGFDKRACVTWGWRPERQRRPLI